MQSKYKWAIGLAWLASNVSLLAANLLNTLENEYGELFATWRFVDAEFVASVAITPLVEESIKWFGIYLLFRLFSRRDALLSSLSMIVLFGIVERIVNRGSLLGMGMPFMALLFFAFRYGVAAATHVLFWTPAALWGVRVRTFLLALTMHGIWNAAMNMPMPWQAVGVGITLLSFAMPIWLFVRLAREWEEEENLDVVVEGEQG